MSRVFDTSDSQQRREALAAASQTISSGRLLVMPTDTVYGVAADAFSPHAVALLLTAKGRGRSTPSPVLVHKPEAVLGIADQIPQQARDLAEKFWPGALTLILHQQPTVTMDLGDSMGTVAVRMPDDDLALDILALTGPLAVSSANRHGQQPARDAADAQEQLGETVDVYIDGGQRGDNSASSTIVDCTGERLRVVRQGSLSLEALREVVPDLLAIDDPEPQAAADPERTEGAEVHEHSAELSADASEAHGSTAVVPEPLPAHAETTEAELALAAEQEEKDQAARVEPAARPADTQDAPALQVSEQDAEDTEPQAPEEAEPSAPKRAK